LMFGGDPHQRAAATTASADASSAVGPSGAEFGHEVAQFELILSPQPAFYYPR